MVWSRRVQEGCSSVVLLVGWRRTFWRPIWIFWRRSSYCVLSDCRHCLTVQKICYWQCFLFETIFYMFQWDLLFSFEFPRWWAQGASICHYIPDSLVQEQFLLLLSVLFRSSGCLQPDVETTLAHSILSVVLCKFYKSAESRPHLAFWSFFIPYPELTWPLQLLYCTVSLNEDYSSL